ncbi:MAG: DUF3667 domain-containing protein [Massilia sp.]
MTPEAMLPHDASHCLNCGTGTGGHFCQQCGQETTLHVPSAREFLHEFVGHYVALEGKLWKSLGLLLFRPGRLTREYVEGRRVRYVLPLRLYLSFSIIFFALMKFNGADVARFDDKPATPRAAVHAQDTPRANKAAGEDQPGDSNNITIGNKEVREWLAPISPALAAKMAKFEGRSSEDREHLFKSAFFSYAPYAVFCLMPLFAGWLKLLYLGSGRRYGEHLLFALHANAFAFLMLSVLLLVPGGVPFLTPALVLWLVFYLPLAMRRVYGGSRWATLVRWIVLMTLHVTSVLLAIVTAFGLAIVA